MSPKSSAPSHRLTFDCCPSLLQEAKASFIKHFQGEPELVVVAPGRVNLIGEHVDYNNGFVMPMAIQRHVVIAAKRISQPEVTLVSTRQNLPASFGLTTPLEPGAPGWANYVKGVLAGFQQRSIQIPGFQAVIAADLPIGGGLSSSAALEVATCRLLEKLTEQHLPALEAIQLCQKAEHTFAGVPCGIMDQFIVTSAKADHALLLDCESLHTRHIPVDSDEISILITHSGVAHELGKGEYAKRRADCERAAKAMGLSSLRNASIADLEKAGPAVDPLAFRRARHVITEIERTPRFAELLESSQWTEAGKLMYASHDSLRSDYEVSCDELDGLVDIARELGPDNGVLGARLTGAGFGGCTVTLVKKDRAESVRATMIDVYFKKTGIRAQSFVTLPAAGAHSVA
jgi:galactokinase